MFFFFLRFISERPNVTSLTPLLKSSDVPTEVKLLFYWCTGAIRPDAVPATINDSKDWRPVGVESLLLGPYPSPSHTDAVLDDY